MTSSPLRFLGIDMSADSFHVHLRHGKRGVKEKFTNDLEGFEALASFLALSPEQPVRAVVEATGLYHLRLVHFLHDLEHLELMIAHPTQVHHFALTHSRRSKSDVKDARVLALYLQTCTFKPWSPSSPSSCELLQLTRHQVSNSRKIARIRNQSHAFSLHPESHRSSLVESLLEQELAAHLAIDKQLEEGIKALLRSEEMSPMEEAIEIMKSAPGVGNRVAQTFAAEFGERLLEMSGKQAVAFMGLDIRERQSGTSVHGRPSISKQGNPRLRALGYLAAMSMARHCPEVAAYKKHLEERGKTSKQAFVAIMRKLVHCLIGMVQSKTEFDPKKFWRGAALPL